jgi:hypothetical protein
MEGWARSPDEGAGFESGVPRFDDTVDGAADHGRAELNRFRITGADFFHQVAHVGVEGEPFRSQQNLPILRPRDRDALEAEIRGCGNAAWMFGKDDAAIDAFVSLHDGRSESRVGKGGRIHAPARRGP